MFFSGITKNSNREILNKNLFTLKRSDGIFWGSLENLIFGGGRGGGGGGGVIKDQYIRHYPKRGAWTVCRFNWGRLAKKRRGCF